MLYMGKNYTIVVYKPSGWDKKNRGGFIEIDSSKALIVEGCGACTIHAIPFNKQNLSHS